MTANSSHQAFHSALKISWHLEGLTVPGQSKGQSTQQEARPLAAPNAKVVKREEPMKDRTRTRGKDATPGIN